MTSQRMGGTRHTVAKVWWLEVSIWDMLYFATLH